MPYVDPRTSAGVNPAAPAALKSKPGLLKSYGSRSSRTLLRWISRAVVRTTRAPRLFHVHVAATSAD